MQKQARPPFIEFIVQAKDDPKRSVEVGYRVTRDVNMVRIVQIGSRDDILKPADEWLKDIRRKALEGAYDAFPEDWVDAFTKKYELWKQGQEAPLIGTSVKEWPVLSPSQVNNLIACHVLTVEDVADMTEQAMAKVGMGSRELREKARDWLKGKEIAQTAIAENAELKKQIAELSARLAELEADKPRRGRPPKMLEAA